jgi:hypothetical protein
MLKGGKDGYYQSIALSKSGYFVPGDVKCTYPIRVGTRDCLLVGRNGEKVSLIEIKKVEQGK